MRGGGRHRFTVFDVLDQQGVFDQNPANSTSPQYNGPVLYPKMFYHPLGKTRVIQKAEVLSTAFGPVKVGEQFELICRTAPDRVEEERLRAAGWHDHPAKAIAASGAEAPPMTATGRIVELEQQLVDLQAKLNAAKAMPVAVEVDEYAA